PALIVFLAWFVTLRAQTINSRHTVWPVGLSLGVVGLVVGVADLGTVTVLAATTAAIFYVAGLNRKHTLTAAMVGLVFIGMLVFAKPYRLKRIIDFVDPNYKVMVWLDPEK